MKKVEEKEEVEIVEGGDDRDAGCTAIKSTKYYELEIVPHILVICVATLDDGYQLVGKGTPAFQPQELKKQREIAYQDVCKQAKVLKEYQAHLG